MLYNHETAKWAATGPTTALARAMDERLRQLRSRLLTAAAEVLRPRRRCGLMPLFGDWFEYTACGGDPALLNVDYPPLLEDALARRTSAFLARLTRVFTPQNLRAYGGIEDLHRHLWPGRRDIRARLAPDWVAESIFEPQKYKVPPPTLHEDYARLAAQMRKLYRLAARAGVTVERWELSDRGDLTATLAFDSGGC